MLNKTALARKIEIAAVFITAILKWILVDGLGTRALFIPLAFAIWIFIIVIKSKQEKHFFKNSGFTLQNLKKPAIICLIAMVFGIGIQLLFGHFKQIEVNQTHLLIAILLYPIWGLLQQFIVMRFVAENLKFYGKNNLQIIAITALAFGSVHIPNWPLFFATFAMGLAFTLLYIRHKNLWPLGITHGVLGAFFYFYVLNEDPIAQIIDQMNLL